MKTEFMEAAIRLADEGMDKGDGGPFGAVVVFKNEIIGRGWNQVIRLNDPTAHAEVMAIRDACSRMKSFQLTGCDIYTSCEPCPMCLGAIYWSRPSKVYYACNKVDAANAGFDDSFIYKEIGIIPESRKIPAIEMMREKALHIFDKWNVKENKIPY